MVTNAKVVRRVALTPDEASDVGLRALFDTSRAARQSSTGLPDGRQIIAKTGPPTCPSQRSLSAAIRSSRSPWGCSPTSRDARPARGRPVSPRLTRRARRHQASRPCIGVGGLQGYGGQWPASIWKTFAMKEFLPMTAQVFPNPDFGGTAWDLLPPQPKPVQTQQQCGNGSSGSTATETETETETRTHPPRLRRTRSPVPTPSVPVATQAAHYCHYCLQREVGQQEVSRTRAPDHCLVAESSGTW